MSSLIFRSLLSHRQTKSIHIIRPLIIRSFAERKDSSSSSSNAISTAKEHSEISSDVKPIGERIKENTKTASYMGVIVLGVSVTGVLFYAICRELLSSNSSNNVYATALDRCINDPRVQDALGSPIKGYGEETRRRRRTHVAHTTFERNGIKHMRMQFYIQGIRNKATVHLEMKENTAGQYDFRYLFVQLDHYPHTTIILEDNRAFDSVVSSSLGSSSSTLLPSDNIDNFKL